MVSGSLLFWFLVLEEDSPPYKNLGWGVMWADCRGRRPVSNCEDGLQTPILPEGAGFEG